jgi:hypothetical protein
MRTGVNVSVNGCRKMMRCAEMRWRHSTFQWIEGEEHSLAAARLAQIDRVALNDQTPEYLLPMPHFLYSLIPWCRVECRPEMRAQHRLLQPEAMFARD